MEFNTGGTADSSNSGAMTGGTMASSMYKNGGEVGKLNGKPFSFYKYDTKKVKIAWKGKIQPFGSFYSVEDAIEELKNHYQTQQELREYSIVTPDGIIHYGKEYPIRYAKGGGLKPIPKGNKGLPKLPESVRNKMGYMAQGGGVKANEHFRLRGVEFLKDDLEKLEQAIKDNNNEEIQNFFSYWGQHLNMLENKNNKRMYNFLEDDLAELEKSIQQNNQEEIDKFFSYWSYHISSLKMAKGGGTKKNITTKKTKTMDKKWSKLIDKAKPAKKPGYRKSPGGGYTENRANRSDANQKTRLEWGGTAESSETGEPIGGENQSSMFSEGGNIGGFTYSIGGL